MISVNLFVVLMFVCMITIPQAFAQEKTGSIDVFVKNTNGDRVAPVGMSIKIFKDLESKPLKEINPLEQNPISISSLPLGHRYKIEIYANSMYSDVGFVDLQKNQEKVDLTIKNAGGLRLNVFYNDAQTPLDNVRVLVRSHDGKLWDSTQTDALGQTERAWLYPPTKPDEYYYAEIVLGQNLKYTYTPIKLLQGVAQDLKVVTKWPVIVDKLITVEVYNTTKNKVTKEDGNFIAQLYSVDKKKIAESTITGKGLGYFAKLKVGNYALYIKTVDSSGALKTIASKKITVTDDLNLVKVYLNNQNLNNDYLNCNCVAFRLDDVQDYFLSSAQVGVLSVFHQKEAPLTIGVIGSVIGTDQKLVSSIKNALAFDRIEIANHSWRHTLYTKMTRSEQQDDLMQTNKKISELFGVTTTTFIPPQNLYNNDTLSILNSNGFTHISSGENGATEEPKKFQKSSFYEFPTFAYTAKLNPDTGYWKHLSNTQTIDQINDSIFNYGYAVVMLHPYEFSVYENGGYSNKPNMTKINDLGLLIDKVRSEGYTLSTIDAIQNFDLPNSNANTKQNDTTDMLSNCNCVAFRLDNVQDFWLNDVQNGLVDTFDQNKIPLTLTVLGKFIGSDPKVVDHIKEKFENKSQIRIANRGWEYVDHTSYDKEKQKTSITQTNDKIKKIFGKNNVIFSPPYDEFNKDTLDALKDAKILYFSSSITKDPRPFPQDSIKHVPSTVTFTNLVDDDPFLSGTSTQKALTKIQMSIAQHGFAVISLQPSDLAVKTDTFENEIDFQKLSLLKAIFSELKSNHINMVMLESIPDSLDVMFIPDWIKTNAKWWSEGKITDSDFIKGIEYLIEQNVIKIPQTEQGTSTKKIPDWIKTNAKWWSEGKIHDGDFVKGIQYLIQNGILVV